VTITTAGIASTVVSDYDGDGRSDFIIWSEEGKDWLIVRSSTGEAETAQWKAEYDPASDSLLRVITTETGSMTWPSSGARAESG
jgi:hypothetical protein